VDKAGATDVDGRAVETNQAALTWATCDSILSTDRTTFRGCIFLFVPVVCAATEVPPRVGAPRTPRDVTRINPGRSGVTTFFADDMLLGSRSFWRATCPSLS